MRWPWQRRERRDSGGDFSDAVVRLIEAQAAGSAADASSTAAVEAASGALSRAFASAEVSAEPWAVEAITPAFLSQVGRDLVRSGDSLHTIEVDRMGGVVLLPCSSWHWEGDSHPDTWYVRATTYGPSSSTTRLLPAGAVVFVRWGSTPGQPYVGIGPTSWAHTTARLQSEAERSLADEVSGPVGQLLPVPQDGGDGSEADPLRNLKADISGARGKALLLETTAAGWGEGMSSAPRADWRAQRLGPMPPDAMATLRADTYSAMLAACGTPAALFDDADGTAQREAYRRFLTLTVQPLARLLAHELSMKLETAVSFDFTGLYAHDLVGRATAFQRLVSAGMSVQDAAATSGLLNAEAN